MIKEIVPLICMFFAVIGLLIFFNGMKWTPYRLATRFKFWQIFRERSEEEVEYRLLELKARLEKRFQARDKEQTDLAMLEERVRGSLAGTDRNALIQQDDNLAKANSKLSKAQQDYDHAVGVAFLSGFGKVTTRIVRKTA